MTALALDFPAAVPAPPTLRDYQALAVKCVERRYAEGVQRLYVELPTGTGKTVVLAELARREIELGGRVLAIAHRRELIDQIARAMRTACGAGRVGVVMGTQDEYDRPVTVATIQSMRFARLSRIAAKGALTLVEIDEVHHVTPGNAYGRLIDNVPDARVCGVSATPFRADGDGMREVVPVCAFSRSIKQMQRAGYLCELDWHRLNLQGLDLSHVKVRKQAEGRDYDQTELDEQMSADELVDEVVDGTAPLIVGRRGVVAFCVSVAHAKALADAYQAAGISARAAWGDMELEDRVELLRAWRGGEIQVVTNCALFTEGFDYPGIDAVVICRPTKIPGLYLQMVGRGTRTSPGKTDCLIVDVAGNIDELKDDQVLLPHVWGSMPVDAEDAGGGGHKLSGLADAKEAMAGGSKARPLFAVSPIQASGIAWAEDPVSGAWGCSRANDEHLLILPDPDGSGLWRCASAKAGTSGPVQILRIRKATGTLYDQVRFLLPSIIDDPDAAYFGGKDEDWRKRPATRASLGVLRSMDREAGDLARAEGWNRGDVSVAIEARLVARIVDALPEDQKPPAI